MQACWTYHRDNYLTFVCLTIWVESIAYAGHVGVGSVSHILVSGLSLVSCGHVRIGSFGLTLSLELGLVFRLLLVDAGVIVGVAAEAIDMAANVGFTAMIMVVATTEQTVIDLSRVLIFTVCFFLRLFSPSSSLLLEDNNFSPKRKSQMF